MGLLRDETARTGKLLTRNPLGEARESEWTLETKTFYSAIESLGGRSERMNVPPTAGQWGLVSRDAALFRLR